ncbi:DMT family transporter [Bifidobacterium thermophilum]|uniref:DMT family transporter n=1 Tax=Bifidobacterium thermophilum TaxID=33905 RepID=UPI0039946F19
MRENEHQHRIVGSVLLLLTSLIWGFAFVSQVQGMQSVSPMFFNAVRFTLGAVSLIPVLVVLSRLEVGRTMQSQQSRPDHAGPGALACWSAVCGLILWAGATSQQYGVQLSMSAGHSGFVTALYIVLVPVLGFLFLHRRIHLLTVLAIIVSIVGFYLLCVTDTIRGIGVGDLVLLASALLYATHILVIDRVGSRFNPIMLSLGQYLVVSLLSWVATLALHQVDWQGALACAGALAYAGIMSVGVAYTLQVVGQRVVPPSQASMIMSLESFFSAVGGALILHETMSGRGYVGCAMIFLGTILAQIDPEHLIRRFSPDDSQQKTIE